MPILQTATYVGLPTKLWFPYFGSLWSLWSRCLQSTRTFCRVFTCARWMVDMFLSVCLFKLLHIWLLVYIRMVSLLTRSFVSTNKYYGHRYSMLLQILGSWLSVPPTPLYGEPQWLWRMHPSATSMPQTINKIFQRRKVATTAMIFPFEDQPFLKGRFNSVRKITLSVPEGWIFTRSATAKDSLIHHLFHSALIYFLIIFSWGPWFYILRSC